MTFAQSADSICVDRNGGGQYTTITEALAALPDFAYQRVVVYIRNGVYGEKIRITQNYVTLRGENRDSTIIRYNQKRTDWESNPDYIGPAVINIHADDCILENMTVENTQPEIESHAFAVYGKGTRTIIRNCNLLSKGGDTVSLWNYQEGLYYHANCYFRGAVDMVCPRGWCFIRDSRFFEVKTSAAIWHDGHYNADQKLVIVNSSFDGVSGFHLGRHHYDAQFFLINCSFSDNMSDRPIYLKTYDDQRRNNPYLWGERKYFYNCHRVGKDFAWHRDNLESISDRTGASGITAAWTFAGRWDPESSQPVTVTASRINGSQLTLIFNENVTVSGQPVFINQQKLEFIIVPQRFTDNKSLLFTARRTLEPRDISGDMQLKTGAIMASTANVNNRHLERQFRIIP